MQECWEMMYDTVDTVYDCIRIATGVLSTLKIRPERMLKGGWSWQLNTHHSGAGFPPWLLQG
jgi:argininosuccinate lyase